MPPREHAPFFGELDYESHPMLVVAIEAVKADDRDARDTAHELISAGLSHLAGNLCDAHVIEELEFVHGWIAKRLAELRGVN